MSIEIKVPMLPESVADATVLKWHKKAGEAIERDETLVELETDKVVLEVPAPESGVVETILKQEGSTVLPKDILAKLVPGKVKPAPKTEQAAPQKVEIPKVEEPSLTPAVRRLVAEHELDAT